MEEAKKLKELMCCEIEKIKLQINTLEKELAIQGNSQMIIKNFK